MMHTLAGFFSLNMTQFGKTPLSIADHIQKLKDQSLIFSNEANVLFSVFCIYQTFLSSKS